MSVFALATAALGLSAPSAQVPVGCMESVFHHSECAVHPYLTKRVSSADECSKLCCDDHDVCSQWSFRWRPFAGSTCSLTKFNEVIGEGLPFFFHTCGVHQPFPTPRPTPTPGPAPAPPGSPRRWAVIAVGSAGYMNYRHQADGCHAYKLMFQSGIPASNIILMMQDDVANSDENPFKGELYNKPGQNPPNVYEGCKPDYRGDIVTAKLFLSVITGDKSAVKGGKVLESGPDDHVFLNFIDHGGVGIVAFPNGPFLHKSELTSGLKTMQEKKMFKELMFYMEACESGSMFSSTMPAPDSKMYAVTAANAKESSWGYYCDGKNDTVKGKQMNTCLGDLFSIAWMEDSDVGPFPSETIDTQVQRVTKRTTKSHVTEFGDMSIKSEAIGRFEVGSSAARVTRESEHDASAMDVRDIPMMISYQKWMSQTDKAAKATAWEEYQKVLASRQADESLFAGIIGRVCGGDLECSQRAAIFRYELVDEACHKALAHAVHESCPRRFDDDAGGWNAFNMKFSQVLVNLCEMKGELNRDPAALEATVREGCASSAAAGLASVLV